MTLETNFVDIPDTHLFGFHETPSRSFDYMNVP